MQSEDNPYRPRKLSKRDIGHELQLQRDLAISNARTLSELGPLPPGGVPLQVKRNSMSPHSEVSAPAIGNEEEMPMKRELAVAVLAASALACQPADHQSAFPLAAKEVVSIQKGQNRANDDLSAMSLAKHDTDDLEIERGGMKFRDSYTDCAQAGTGATDEILACIAEEFEYQDARLNSAYRRLMHQLSDEQKVRLRDEQKDWLSEMGKKCRWDPEIEGGGR